MFAKILQANDGSDRAFKALAAALDLARRYQSELHMICVEEMPNVPATIDEIIEEQLDANHFFRPIIKRARDLARLQEVALATHLIAGHPVRSIVEFVERNRFDLLVVGFMGHSALFDRIIGGTADRLVRLAPCAVLVVK
jgi:nucleotide-binding universal stress UspA family protein